MGVGRDGLGVLSLRRQERSVRALTPAQRTYAAGRAKGLTQTEAAEEAGSSRPREAGSRWEKDPDIKREIARLKRAAEVLAAEDPAQLPAQLLGTTAQLAAQQAQITAVADQAEVLRLSTDAARRTQGRKVTREFVEIEPAGVDEAGKPVMRPVAVKVEDDGVKALDRLLRHYDGQDAPKGPQNQLNVQVVLSSLPESVLGALAAAVRQARTE